ncbi:GSCFA domain-containing protein [Reichenbachiella agarivorans]|uniref:GSCFA domain-containing protein n=1 Tax=Reichenbachiella agarivorans TaxID=2979464 RepID=A0ABY6CLQ4_9BACT|nr:GSCFA domain-containing protein [Reichenbachiella agarivorans]UXP31324.1 GSCFA domain-containing protein [Reichenbachiella agarivorans]
MQAYKTDIRLKTFPSQIKHGQKILTLGSCFAQEMGERLTVNKFDVLVNPYGVIFNPLSIFHALKDSMVHPDGYVVRDGMTCHFDYHFDLRAESRDTLQTMIQNRNEQVQTRLKEADWLVLTFGSAHVYELKSTGQVVANCHKVSQANFDKRLLGLPEMKAAFDSLLQSLRVINPTLKIVLTVSPVRHIKDGMEEDQLSKSLLRVFCATLIKDSSIYYFPSYEIMMDDLRDYRFYKEDLIHPNKQAEDYIWNCFRQVAFNAETQNLIQKWQNVLMAMQHRPFNPSSTEYQLFLQSAMKKLEELSGDLDIAQEKVWFMKQLSQE